MQQQQQQPRRPLLPSLVELPLPLLLRLQKESRAAAAPPRKSPASPSPAPPRGSLRRGPRMPRSAAGSRRPPRRRRPSRGGARRSRGGGEEDFFFNCFEVESREKVSRRCRRSARRSLERRQCPKIQLRLSPSHYRPLSSHQSQRLDVEVEERRGALLRWRFPRWRRMGLLHCSV